MARATKKNVQHPPEDDICPPQQRVRLYGHQVVQGFVRERLMQNSLTNGWMICGPAKLGKATLAYLVAKAQLSGQAWQGQGGLAVDPEAQACRWIDQKAHPDLFVAERLWDEKKNRYATEITIDTIRKLISFMSKTSSGLGRVVIIDKADELNRNAANALLKVLEEPPVGVLLLLVTDAPGLLLPTLRSRCRRLNMLPVETEQVATFLQTEGIEPAEEAGKFARIADGRPGYGLALAKGQGAVAVALVEQYLAAVQMGKGLHLVAQQLSPAMAAPLWQAFREILLQALSKAAKAQAIGEVPVHNLSSVSAGRLANAWTEMSQMARRGEGVNTDKGQLALAMGTRLRQIFAKG